MLGGFFALLAAATFAWTNAAARRGVLSGSAAQAVMLSVPIGVPIFLIALVLIGQIQAFAGLSLTSIAVFAGVGISHFCFGRYCNYRAIQAVGTNLAGPVMQFNLVVSLALAIAFLGEVLTPLRILGILLIVVGPALAPRHGARRTAEQASAPQFTPRMAEGYAFAFLAALCYGASPPLVRFAVDGQGLSAGLAGGVIAAGSATAFALVMLLAPGARGQLRDIDPEAAKWFLSSGMIVYVSQIFAYMAVALAPVTVTAPIIGLNHVFRLHFSRWLNPDHEVFGSQVIAATAVSFLGVVVLSASLEALPLPPEWLAALNWHWP